MSLPYPLGQRRENGSNGHHARIFENRRAQQSAGHMAENHSPDVDGKSPLPVTGQADRSL